MIKGIIGLAIFSIIALALNSIYNKINIDQKEKKERWILNSISVLIVFFLVFFIFLLFQDYNYYKIYDIEYLKTFFSFGEQLFFNLRYSLMFAFINMIIYQPIFFVLDNLKKKNICQIILAIILMTIIDFIILIKNISITF